MTNTTIDNEMLDIFKNLGIPDREGRILIALNKNIEGLKQKDVCVEGYLYQPEASVGLISLQSKGWVSIISRVLPNGKGRPYAIYALCKTFDEILNEIREGIDASYKLSVADIERLKEIA